MKYGLFGLHRGTSAEPDVLAQRARRAEEVGFESLWVGDHIALPAMGDYDPAQEPRFEALATLTYLAALTETVKLAVGVIVLPQRQPVLLAKQLATIDVLSGGRLIFGVGAGYVEQELNALGVQLSERGARTDEYLDAVKALWDEPTPTFAGRFVAFDGVIGRPRPLQRPHPPIVVGGTSRAAYRRAVTSADGWYGFHLDVDEAARAIADSARGSAGARAHTRARDHDHAGRDARPRDRAALRGRGRASADDPAAGLRGRRDRRADRARRREPRRSRVKRRQSAIS